MTSLEIQVVVGASLAGFVQGLSGFAFGLIVTAIWIWSVEPSLLVPTVIFGSFIGQLLSVQAVREHVDFSRASPFLAGGLVGVPLGVYIFHHIDDTIFRIGVGVILITYCSVMLTIGKLPVVKAGGRFADAGVGLISGIMGGAGGLSGPAPIIWCALRGWDKNIQRATYQPLFIIIQILALIIFTVTGAITAKTLQMFALVAPAVVIPTWLGARAYKSVPEASFRKLLLLLLLLSGFSLVLPSVSNVVSRFL